MSPIRVWSNLVYTFLDSALFIAEFQILLSLNYFFYFSDITCGKEKIPIPCINEMDDVAAPLDFVYVKESFESSYLCINRNMNVVKVIHKVDLGFLHCSCYNKEIVLWLQPPRM